jgi:hypothetical protein
MIQVSRGRRSQRWLRRRLRSAGSRSDSGLDARARSPRGTRLRARQSAARPLRRRKMRCHPPATHSAQPRYLDWRRRIHDGRRQDRPDGGLIGRGGSSHRARARCLRLGRTRGSRCGRRRSQSSRAGTHTTGSRNAGAATARPARRAFPLVRERPAGSPFRTFSHPPSLPARPGTRKHASVRELTQRQMLP